MKADLASANIRNCVLDDRAAIAGHQVVDGHPDRPANLARLGDDLTGSVVFLGTADLGDRFHSVVFAFTIWLPTIFVQRGFSVVQFGREFRLRVVTLSVAKGDRAITVITYCEMQIGKTSARDWLILCYVLLVPFYALHIHALEHLRGGFIEQFVAPYLLEASQEVIHAQAALFGAVQIMQDTATMHHNKPIT